MTVVLSECLGVKWIDSSLIVQNDKGGGYELGKLYANASCIIIIVGIRCWTVGIDSSLITQNDKKELKINKKQPKIKLFVSLFKCNI